MTTTQRTFEIEACLGRGGFGEVYRARMSRGPGVASDVALKVLRRDIDPDGQAVERLRDEGRLLAQLNHPSILRVHDLIVLDGRISLITEYVDGDDLSTCLADGEPIGRRALLEVVARVAGALDAAWTARLPDSDIPLHLVHRDIKPSNIRLSRHGGVKLLDFGIARTDSVEREARTRTNMMVGSPAYMAPERFVRKDVLVESDVFSLGAVLFEGLAPDRFYGDLPVPMQVGLAISEERYDTYFDEQLAKTDAPPEIRALLTDAMAWDPENRPSPSEFARRCDLLADSQKGATLARYCRSRTWSTVARLAGELDGRTLSEGRERPKAPRPLAPTLSPDASAPSEPAEEPRSRWGMALIGMGGMGMVGTLGLLGVLAVVLVAVPFLPGLWETPVPEEGDTEPVESVAPVPDAPIEPPPEPSPDPVEPSPAPIVPRPEPPVPVVRPAPPPEPEPVVPEAPEPVVPQPVVAEPSVPEPAVPEPSGEPPGRLRVEGGVPVTASGPGGVYSLPASVAPGTYFLKAKYNGVDAVEAGKVQVHSGVTVTVSCSARMTRCGLK